MFAENSEKQSSRTLKSRFHFLHSFELYRIKLKNGVCSFILSRFNAKQRNHSRIKYLRKVKNLEF